MYTFLSKRIQAVFTFLLLLTLSLSLLPSHAVNADEGGFDFDRYEVKATLRQDNTMEVHERLDVNFYQPRHGIYRNIPTSMTVGFTQEEKEADPLNTWRPETYQLDIQDIKVEGADASISNEDGDLSIRIGSANYTVTGVQTYDIYYTIVFPKDYRDSRDFIFYSPLGADWNCIIRNFSFELNLEKSLTKEEMDSIQIYSGSFGRDNNALDINYTVEKNRITGSKDSIYASNAITVFGSLHEGYFANAQQTVSSFPAWIAAGFSLIASLFVILKEFSLKGRKLIETVEFYPPEGIDSAQVGFLIDRSCDVADMMSLVPYWGNQGYLTIEETNHDSYRLNKVKDLALDAPEYQRILFNALFSGRNSVDMDSIRSSTAFARSLISAQSALPHTFTGQKQIVKEHAGFIMLSLVSVIGLAGCILFNSQAGIMAHIFELIFCMGSIFTLWVIHFANSTTRHFSQKTPIGIHLINLLFSVLALLALAVAITANDRLLPIPVVALDFVLVIVTIFNLYSLTEPTDYWYDNAGKLAGLKTFIKKAEVPQLERLSKENPSYFFDVIPYAMAFGLTKQWSDAFKTIPLTQPIWYSGTRYRNSYYYHNMFDHGITSSASSSISSYQAATSSSSGGFSGGGGGGGGGGSW